MAGGRTALKLSELEAADRHRVMRKQTDITVLPHRTGRVLMCGMDSRCVDFCQALGARTGGCPCREMRNKAPEEGMFN